jgi:hypothetical protein
MLRTRIAIGAVFVFGCVTGGVASQMVVPPAKAGAAVTTWDYYCTQLDTSQPNKQQAILRQAGAQGWELVTVESSDKTWGNACFKRRL